MSSWMFLSRNIVGHWLMDLDGFILGSQSRPHFLGKYYPAVISGRLSLKPLAHHRPRAISEATRTISAFFICACVLSCFSHVRLFANLWTIAHQTPLSMGFSRQEYWSGLPFPSPEDLPNQGSNPDLLHCSRFFTIWATRESFFPLGNHEFGSTSAMLSVL